MSKPTVMIGLSGGVDSAVSAYLLQQQGYDVQALFMVNWEGDEEGYCTSAEDFQSARLVADELNIPLHRANFAAEYEANVFQYFLTEYAAGRTPNPDVLCNREIKFNVFADYAAQLGADWIATGHYAQLRHDDNGTFLLRAPDDNKDQTYFLAAVPRERFDKVLFPIGHLTKPQVRELATRVGLPNHTRSDSTGICFIGERRLREFLGTYLPAQAGDIVTVDGKRVGKHTGLMYYTIGQRKGIGVGGVRGGHATPWFVCEKNLETNQLVITQDMQHPALMRHTLTVKQWHWLVSTPTLPFTGQARIRHRQALQNCTVLQNGNDYTVQFEQAQWAIAAGQFVVLYDGEVCVGSGVIQ